MALSLFLAFGCAPRTLFGALQSSAAPSTAASEYTCVQRGPNSRVWQKAVVSTNAAGLVTTNLGAYTELATGLCYLNPASGQYVDSVEGIQLTAMGAEAINGRQQVRWAANANTPNGAVTVTTPDGKQLSSTVYGLAYYDVSSGSNAPLAWVQDCTGAIIGSNQVVYSDGFTNLTADICYTYRKAGLSQDIVIRQQPPSPESYGLSPQTTILQVYTEFFRPPQPALAVVVTNNGSTDVRRLSFGEMKMPVGRALFLRSQDASAQAGAVSKQWVQIENRTFLIESIPYGSISNFLRHLPPQASNFKPDKSQVRRTVRLNPRPLQKKRVKSEGVMKVAKGKPAQARLVMDYELIDEADPSVLQGDTTYLVSDLYTPNGLTMEGGTVVKFANNTNAEIDVESDTPNVFCQGGHYRPIIFTSVNDDSVGQKISGSTGNPSSDAAGNFAIFIDQASVGQGPYYLQNIRFSHLAACISFENAYQEFGGILSMSDFQIVNCGSAFVTDGATLSLNNGLIYNVNVVFDQITDGYIPDAWVGQSESCVNLTFHNCNMFAQDWGTTLSLTNCLVVDETNFDWEMGNYSSTGTVVLDSDTGVFQTAGAGAHYLAANSPYRNAGTTNIDPAVLADLQSTTTYPPVIIPAGWFTNDYTFFPQAQRDTDAADIGYHYDPLDYAVSMEVSNAIVTVLPGTALGTYGSYGLWLYSKATVNCKGTATSPSYVARYNTVQEQSNTNWESPSWSGSVVAPNQVDISSGNFSFTDWPVLASDFQLGTSKYSCAFGFQDCQFYGGEIYDAGPAIASTNSLYERVKVQLTDIGTMADSFYNNLFLEGSLSVTHTNSGSWTFRDNLFDQTFITNSGGATINSCYNNAYVTGFATLLPENHDVILAASPAYEGGALGVNYYPSSLTSLIHTGSQPAPQAGLYHYTVTTNNAIEGTNIVSIGFHYVAVGANSLPLDNNGDGIPDYIEDINGNGMVDSDEIDWQVAGDLGLTIAIIRPLSNSRVP
ncbi:MAG TPA: hypothetical protein VH595_09710 [Verrucomicrobiae bacterium]|nr:hypothetical protein [Verrucomicrobiae bacterium]